MAYCVAIRCRSLLNFFSEDVEALCRLSNLIRRACQADDTRLEPRHKLGKRGGSVPFGIDGNEKGLDLICFGAKTVHDRGNFGQRRRTNIGAVRKAEEYQHPPAGKFLVRAALAAMIGQNPLERLVPSHYAQCCRGIRSRA